MPKIDNSLDSNIYTFVLLATGIIEAIISSTMPKLLLAYNAIDKLVSYHAGQKLGHITDCKMEMANFVI